MVLMLLTFKGHPGVIEDTRGFQQVLETGEGGAGLASHHGDKRGSADKGCFQNRFSGIEG